MIRLSDLTLRRGRRTVLQGLEVTLRPGEVTVLLGPNGSGKSTLLSAIAGTLAYSGALSINGVEVAGATPEALAELRAVLPQDNTLSFPFRVAEIVAMGARGALAARPAALAQRIASLLADLGLAGFGPRNAQALSGGETQRMHLARALLQAETAKGNPVWLMLDEPVSSLDLGHQLAVMDQARNFARQGGGVLAVLHDLNLAIRCADRILVLDRGQIVADGAPATVLKDPLVEAVYGCLVPMNRLPKSQPFLLVQADLP